LTQLANLNYRTKIMNLEEAMLKSPGSVREFPLKHSFADGMYVREISVPKGYIVVTKIHKYSHPCFILKGKCLVLSENGIKTVTCPHSMITPAGTKRIVYVIEDTIWATVHKTNETDLDLIEKEVIAANFDDFDKMITKEEVKLFMDIASEVAI
jgi:hypothetical protein